VALKARYIELKMVGKVGHLLVLLSKIPRHPPECSLSICAIPRMDFSSEVITSPRTFQALLLELQMAEKAGEPLRVGFPAIGHV
jgi:hypothetical protein|tara:strand:+ start:191 stop:442 length:252 start_codon:yes stop_codon:yes gene_type:complete